MDKDNNSSQDATKVMETKQDINMKIKAELLNINILINKRLPDSIRDSNLIIKRVTNLKKLLLTAKTGNNKRLIKEEEDNQFVYKTAKNRMIFENKEVNGYFDLENSSNAYTNRTLHYNTSLKRDFAVESYYSKNKFEIKLMKRRNEKSDQEENQSQKKTRQSTDINYGELSEEELEENLIDKGVNKETLDARISNITGKPVRAYRKSTTRLNVITDNNLAQTSMPAGSQVTMPKETTQNKMKPQTGIPISSTTLKAPKSMNTTNNVTKTNSNNLSKDIEAKLMSFGLEKQKHNKNSSKMGYVTVPENSKKVVTKEKDTDEEVIMDEQIITLDDVYSATDELIRIKSNMVSQTEQIAAYNLMGGNEKQPTKKLNLNLNSEQQDKMVINLEKLIDSNYLDDTNKDIISSVITKIKSNLLDEIDMNLISKLKEIECLHDKSSKLFETAKSRINKIYNNKQLLSNETIKNIETIENSLKHTWKINQSENKFMDETIQLIDQLDKFKVIKLTLTSYLEECDNEFKPKIRSILETNANFVPENQENLNQLFNNIQIEVEAFKKRKKIKLDIQELLTEAHLGNKHKEMLELILEQNSLKEADSKLVSEVRNICSTINNDFDYYNKMKKLLVDNEPLEIKYPREKGYSMQISGPGIFAFDNQMKSRQNEITRCTGVKTFSVVELRREKTEDEQDMTEDEFMEMLLTETSGTRDIFITVKTYKDLCKLMQPWPSDAFDKGVKPKLKPIDDFSLALYGIEREITKEKIESIAYDMENDYGLVDIRRQYIKNDIKNPSTTVLAKVLTLIQLLMVLRDSVPIDPKYREVKIKYNEFRVCSKCGSVDHFRCNLEKCIICGKTDHLTSNCPIEYNKQRCINCHRLNHRCDTEECNMVRVKKYKANDYILSILLGENLIKDQSEILRNPDAEKHERETLKEEQIEEMVNNLIDKNARINNMEDRLVLQEEKTQRIEQQLENLTTNQLEIISQMNELREDFKAESTVTRIDNQEKHNDIMTTLSYMLNNMPSQNKKRGGSG